jgi:four helix bundle protein
LGGVANCAIADDCASCKFCDQLSLRLIDRAGFRRTAANYRAARLGRSGREFVAKIGTVREEADETVFWLSFMERVAIVPSGASRETAQLKDEAEQLARIFAASYRTARRS